MLWLFLHIALVAASSSQSATCDWTGEYFPDIPVIQYEGPGSDNLLAFHYYNASEVIMGKPMKEWLRFAVAIWHFRGQGVDIFGGPSRKWPWIQDGLSDEETSIRHLEAMFEMMKKLGIEFWCFHDRDISTYGEDVKETNEKFNKMVDVVSSMQDKNGFRVLWATSQLFHHPRYMNGAAVNPDADVFAYAASQAKAALDAAKKLKAGGFNFWGGREGYATLRNTNLRLALDNYAKFLRMAAEYKKKIGYQGSLYLEPKPQEPTKHQYNYDAATTQGFLLNYGLQEEYELVIECNHATLSGHSCEHEMAFSSAYGILGSVDINTGDAQTGWDTDQFLTDVGEATRIMSIIIKQGGIAPGGFNFDAKLRRESIDPHDLFYAHIAGMDALARGLRNAARLIEDGVLDKAIEDRYSSFNSGIGKLITDGKVGFEELNDYALGREDPYEHIQSGQEEKFDLIFSRFVR